MNIHKLRLIAAALIFVAAPHVAMADGLVFPAIKDFGGVYPLMHAAEQPDPSKTYKVIFDVTKGRKNRSQINPGVLHVARAVNIMVLAGVPLSHLHIVAILHGKATSSVLDNKHYKAMFGTNNPNIALFRALQKIGVRVEVCGQAMLDNHYPLAWANPYVKPTLSALSTLIIYGNQGYAYVKQ